MKKVMTVDDSATVRQALSIALSEAGYEVHEARDGLEALEKLNKGPVDMLVTDLNMPKMSGIDLIREVRRMPGNRFMPIIMLSSESQADQIKAGKAKLDGNRKPYEQLKTMLVQFSMDFEILPGTKPATPAKAEESPFEQRPPAVQTITD